MSLHDWVHTLTNTCTCAFPKHKLKSAVYNSPAAVLISLPHGLQCHRRGNYTTKILHRLRNGTLVLAGLCGQLHLAVYVDLCRRVALGHTSVWSGR